MISDVDPQASWADSVPDAMDDSDALLENTPDQPSYATVASRPRARRSSVSSVLSHSSAPDPDFQRYYDKQTTFEKDHFHPFNSLPDRPCSAFIHVDKDVSTANIFADVRNAGLPHSSVRCIQRTSTGSAFITFASEERRNLYLQKSSYISRTNRDDSDCVFVAVYDAPFELSDDAIKHRLSSYGTVHSSRRCKLQGYPDVYNGIRVFKCDLDDPIPSFLRFGRLLLRVKHPNQVPTCRKCNYTGHVVKDCPNQVCFNCEGLGHVTSECPSPARCVICRATGHYAVDCRFSWKPRPAHHTADDDEPLPPPPPAFQESSSSPVPDVPDSQDIIPPTQPSQSSQSSQPSQSILSSQPLPRSQSSRSSQPSQPPQPSHPSVLSPTASDVLLAAAASDASDAAVASALPSPDVVASSGSSPNQSSGSSTTSATTSSGSSSSSSAQSASCSAGSPDASSQAPSTSSPSLFSSSPSEPVPVVFQPSGNDATMDDDSQLSALGGAFKTVTNRKRRGAAPIIPNRRPAKCINSDVPPTRKSTAPTAVSSRRSKKS